jgi:hypothetical protein
MTTDFKPVLAAHHAQRERRNDFLTQCAKAAIIAAACTYLLMVNL